jgi:8-oxo-dGTP pyrophosphatase MutT (NUDIX family)
MRAILTCERPVELDLPELRRRLAGPVAAGRAPESEPGAGESGPPLTSASVLLPIVVHADELTVLFTQRTAHLRNHSGQVSFPGGRAEPHDPSPEFTALRETREEIGLPEHRIEVIGRLSQYCTRTGYCITPVIGVVSAPLALVPDAREVEEVFEVPLSFLLDPRNHQWHSRVWQGETRWFFAIAFGSRYIWGATAGMLVSFYRRLALPVV